MFATAFLTAFAVTLLVGCAALIVWWLNEVENV